MVCLKSGYAIIYVPIYESYFPRRKVASVHAKSTKELVCGGCPVRCLQYFDWKSFRGDAEIYGICEV